MLPISRRGLASVVLSAIVAAATLSAQTTPPPVQTPIPRPFPTGSTPPPVSTPKPSATPAPTTTPGGGPADGGTIDPRLARLPLYPGAELLQSIDLGKSQWMWVFGTNDPYLSIVDFYKTQLKKSGEEVSRTPSIYQFDLGSFDSGVMDQRPSVMVKDYTWQQPTGYIHVAGTTEKRFKTLIQIIPAAR